MIATEFSGISLQIAAISANSSFVALSESVGAMYVLSRCARCVTKVFKQIPVAYWGFSCEDVLLLVDLADDGLLDSVLCALFNDGSILPFNLYHSCAASPLLPGNVVQFLPEVLLMLPLNDSADFVESFFVLLLLSNPFLTF